MRTFLFKNSIMVLGLFLLISCGSKVPFTRGVTVEGEEKKLGASADSLRVADFDRYVLPVLEQNCSTCHDNPAPDYNTASTLVKAGRPEESDLYLRATGQKSHTKILDPESQQARNIEDWIKSSTPAVEPKPVIANPTPATPIPPANPPAVNAACAIDMDLDKQVCEDIFLEKILPDLIKSCYRCHDNPGPNYPTALTLIKPGVPLESELYTRATGIKAHKKIWAVDSVQAKNLESWINGK